MDVLRQLDVRALQPRRRNHMKKTLVTAALAGSLLVASAAPAQATTAFEECPPPIVHPRYILDCAKWAYNTACDLFVPPSVPCSWTRG